jgi:hypothetical protein
MRLGLVAFVILESPILAIVLVVGLVHAPRAVEEPGARLPCDSRARSDSPSAPRTPVFSSRSSGRCRSRTALAARD